jgi:hypothetical protein
MPPGGLLSGFLDGLKRSSSLTSLSMVSMGSEGGGVVAAGAGALTERISKDTVMRMVHTLVSAVSLRKLNCRCVLCRSCFVPVWCYCPFNCGAEITC